MLKVLIIGRFRAFPQIYASFCALYFLKKPRKTTFLGLIYINTSSMVLTIIEKYLEL